MKKTNLTLAALAFTTVSAFAGGPEAVVVEPSFNGFYAGAAVGAVSTNFGLRSNDTTTTVIGAALGPEVPVPTQIGNTSVNAYNPQGTTNFLGNVFLGYGMTFHSFYIGGEVFGNFGKSRSTANSDGIAIAQAVGADVLQPMSTSVFSAKNEVRLRDAEAGVDARLGFLLTPTTLPYVRVGVTCNRIRETLVSNLSNDTGPSDPLSNVAFNVSGSRTGARIGGGFEQLINQYLGLRADYIYTDYGTFKNESRVNVLGVNMPSQGFATSSSLTRNVRIRTHSNSVLFGLVYHIVV